VIWRSRCGLWRKRFVQRLLHHTVHIFFFLQIIQQNLNRIFYILLIT
jgi:hypothetical protein